MLECFFKSKILVYTALLGFCLSSWAVSNPVNFEDKYPIIPTPKELIYGNDEIQFKNINIQATDFKNEGRLLADFFESKQIEANAKGLTIELKKSNAENANDEAYSLIVSDKIAITAATHKGIFYGIQTLKQIFRKQGKTGVLPKLTVTDWPAFKIRGFMHDTGRNFQSVSQLKEQIEVLSQYKYNVFHWHLTDNPGWRLESKLYPELQSETATSRHKGKFYTQDDFKEILAFCKARNITLIPEFDIPGHTEAFRKALKIDTMRDPKVKPVLLDLFQELMDLTNAEDVPYIHMGTDEVRNKYERVSNAVILEIMNLIKKIIEKSLFGKKALKLKKTRPQSINYGHNIHRVRGIVLWIPGRITSTTSTPLPACRVCFFSNPVANQKAML